MSFSEKGGALTASLLCDFCGKCFVLRPEALSIRMGADSSTRFVQHCLPHEAHRRLLLRIFHEQVQEGLSPNERVFEMVSTKRTKNLRRTVWETLLDGVLED
jgi:hypothetical protein